MVLRQVPVDWLEWVLLIGIGLVVLLVTGPTAISSEIQKLVVLSWVVSVGLLSWFVVTISQRRLTWRWSLVDIGVLLWYGVMVLATLHSTLPWISVFGFNDQYADGLFASTIFVLLYVVLVRFPGDLHPRRWAWMLVVVGVLGAVGLDLSAAGLLVASPLSALVSQSSIFLAALVPLVFSLRQLSADRCSRILSLVSLPILLLTLCVLDQTQSWVVLLVGLGAWLVIQAWEVKTLPVGAVILAALIMLVSVVFLSVDVHVFQQDVFISTRQAWELFFLHVQNAALGVGPNNFVLLSAEQAPSAGAYVTLTHSSVWQWLATTGVLGLGAWLVLVGLGFWKVKHTKDTEQLIFLIPWGMIILSAFFLPVGFVQLLAFWLMLAFVVRPSVHVATFSMSEHILARVCLPIAGVLCLVLVLLNGVYSSSLLRAEILYRQAQQQFLVQHDVPGAQHHLTQAHDLVPQQPEYTFALAEALLLQQKPEDVPTIRSLIELGLQNAPYQTEWKNILEKLSNN